jgi:hypothetical protein
MDVVYSLNHRISPSVISLELSRTLAKFQKLGRHEQLLCGDDTSICTSTAYEWCQTPLYMSDMDVRSNGCCLQPQSPHFTISYLLGII